MTNATFFLIVIKSPSLLIWLSFIWTHPAPTFLCLKKFPILWVQLRGRAISHCPGQYCKFLCSQANLACRVPAPDQIRCTCSCFRSKGHGRKGKSASVVGSGTVRSGPQKTAAAACRALCHLGTQVRHLTVQPGQPGPQSLSQILPTSGSSLYKPLSF